MDPDHALVAGEPSLRVREYPDPGRVDEVESAAVDGDRRMAAIDEGVEDGDEVGRADQVELARDGHDSTVFEADREFQAGVRLGQHGDLGFLSRSAARQALAVEGTRSLPLCRRS